MTPPSGSEFERDVTRRRADAELDGSAGLLDDGAAPEIAHAARHEARIAAVADAHPAAVGRVQAGVLGDPQEIRAAVGAHLDAAPGEPDVPASEVGRERRPRRV